MSEELERPNNHIAKIYDSKENTSPNNQNKHRARSYDVKEEPERQDETNGNSESPDSKIADPTQVVEELFNTIAANPKLDALMKKLSKS